MSLQTISPPIETETLGGYRAVIFEIDSDDVSAEIKGSIETPGTGTTTVEWSDSGICRGLDYKANRTSLHRSNGAVVSHAD